MKTHPMPLQVECDFSLGNTMRVVGPRWLPVMPLTAFAYKKPNNRSYEIYAVRSCA